MVEEEDQEVGLAVSDQESWHTMLGQAEKGKFPVDKEEFVLGIALR
jgi:hypothetical protein